METTKARLKLLIHGFLFAEMDLCILSGDLLTADGVFDLDKLAVSIIEEFNITSPELQEKGEVKNADH